MDSEVPGSRRFRSKRALPSFPRPFAPMNTRRHKK